MNKIKIIFEYDRYFLEISHDNFKEITTRFELSRDQLLSLHGNINKYI